MLVEALFQINRKLNIALIEDDPFDYRLIGELLKRIKGLDFDLAWAKSFDEANALLESRTFDLAFVDFTIGQRTGVDVVRAQGGRESATPMIMLTGCGSLEVDLQAMEAGAYDFLDKGEVSVGQLDRAIRYTLQSRQMEIELRDARDLAEKASKAKSTFLSHISHDLKTPLNAIVGFAELIMMGLAKTEEIEAYVSQIYSSGRHLTEMIEDLLTLTYFDMQKAKCHPKEHDIEAALEEVIHLTKYAAMEKGVNVSTLAADQGATVFADKKALIRVLVNVLSVAIKHSDSKQKIHLSTIALETETTLLVWWDGSPILPAVVEDVLNENPYSSDAYTTSSNGIGLSLSIAHQYMLMHKGSMTIDTKARGGMCVRLEFPNNVSIEDAQEDHQQAHVLN